MDEELLDAYDEYIALLEESEKILLGFAHVHGYECPNHLVERGKQLRKKIATLRISRNSE